MDPASGCAGFRLAIGAAYQAVRPVQRTCAWPWSQLQGEALAAVGRPGFDLRKMIEQRLPAAARPVIERDPTYACDDPLQAPPASPGAGPLTGVQVSGQQPFPLFGWARVSWSS
jgi:hypothetical protein